MKNLVFSLFFALLCQMAFSADATVVKVHGGKRFVTISQNYVEPWGVEDEVCLIRAGKEIACGFVTFSEPESALVKLDRFFDRVEKNQSVNSEKTLIELTLSKEAPEENDEVRLLTRNPKVSIQKTLKEMARANPFNSRTLASSEEQEETAEVKKSKLLELRKLKEKLYWDDNTNPVSAISIGIDYAWPFVEYTQSVSRRSAVTLRAVKLNYPIGGGFLDGVGGFITYNFYTARPLRGFWMQWGTGVYSMSIERGGASAKTWMASLMTTAGYKVVWKDTISFGFAGGIEYLPNANMSSIKLDFSGVLPTFMLSAGYFF